MITIKINSTHSLVSNKMKTTRCPKCNAIINSWEWPPKKCRSCKFNLVNTNNLVDYKPSRVDYHKTGPY